jgi:hypothetical protein
MCVSFREAIGIMGDCNYYDINADPMVWKNAGITPESFYKGLLIKLIQINSISLYGRKIHGSKERLQKIEENEVKALHLDEDCSFLYEILSDGSHQNIYTHLTFNKNELSMLTKPREIKETPPDKSSVITFIQQNIKMITEWLDILIIWIRKKNSFTEAIHIIADCGYYEANGNKMMWENIGVNRTSFYKNLLIENIKKKEISLYGRKIYSSKQKLQKIDSHEFRQLHFVEDGNFVSSVLSDDWSGHAVYIDVIFNKSELLDLVKKLKKKLSALLTTPHNDTP